MLCTSTGVRLEMSWSKAVINHKHITCPVRHLNSNDIYFHQESIFLRDLHEHQAPHCRSRHAQPANSWVSDMSMVGPRVNLIHFLSRNIHEFPGGQKSREKTLRVQPDSHVLVARRA